MLNSIAIILIAGLLPARFCKKLHIPSLVGMIIAGIIIGPYVLNLLDNQILEISSDLRRIALIIILIRAGLKLDLSELKKVGRPALLMCFLPACFEILGMIVLAPTFLGFSILEATILGSVVGAVSPAVVVPRMIKLIDEGYGQRKAIPQMILAGASVDDVFVIVLFTSFTSLAQGKSISWINFINIPLSIMAGVIFGTLLGFLLYHFTRRYNINHTILISIVLALSFFMNEIEISFPFIPFAGLLAIMALGTELKHCSPELAESLSNTFDKLWSVAEIFLFVLVGASVAVSSLRNAGLAAITLVPGALAFRVIGVYISVFGTPLTIKEKLFCILAYTPKATVQAAIGALPLAMGLACGMDVLTVSVIAILITAPLGAFAIDLSYRKLLNQE